MVLFRKDSEATDVPISGPLPERGWLVWLLSVVTFFLTVAIVLGLFWAGRWVIHQFTAKKPAPVATPALTTDSSVNNSRDTAARASAPASTANNAPASTGGSATPSPTSSSTPSTTTPPATSPTTSQTRLVNTGPDSDE